MVVGYLAGFFYYVERKLRYLLLFLDWNYNMVCAHPVYGVVDVLIKSKVATNSNFAFLDNPIDFLLFSKLKPFFILE